MSRDTQQLDLYPLHYRLLRQAKRAVLLWTAAVFGLAAILIGNLTLQWRANAQQQARDQEIVAASSSVNQLRRIVTVLESDNARRRQWVQWVETAKPDDSLLQSLAVVTAATHPATPQNAEQHLDVQRVSIKLPVEYPASADATPNWAQPSLSVVAITKSRGQAMEWMERVAESPRVRQVDVSTPNGKWSEAVAKLSGQPVSTKVLP
ncbi:hypothetical protein [Stieleria varia]|uniref:Fimbrial assembly protein (PilN) n=1 Tax=Stieleria varia TaxID=2528005 RepID=A0A5C6A3Y2_9BACT|nr:hypothetical protein [Stieleria varia]TWT93978.1 hypothetical protein Pla52n_58070 [Stieleria varia]